MNGEIYLLARMVTAARYALEHKNDIQYTTEPQDKTQMLFRHKPDLRWWGHKRPPIHSHVADWYKECRRRGMCDIRLKVPLGVNAPYELGFANMNRGEILCYHKNGQVTAFMATWYFTEQERHWNVVFEEEARTSLLPKPQFEDNTETFLKALVDVKTLAEELEFPFFAHHFGIAADILRGCTPDFAQIGPDLRLLPAVEPWTFLPESRLRLMKAAWVADVFGAMGSWNDSPPCVAHDRRMTERYEQCSAELLKQMRTAIMVAVNG